MYKHQPSVVVAYLPDDRALATNATADCYFVLSPDGSFESIDVARAVALYRQRVSQHQATKTERAHLREKMKRILASDGGGIEARRKRINREQARRRRQQQDVQYDKRTKHIRIADKAQELEDKIRRLDAQLDAELAAVTEGTEEQGEHT